jgi:hypothetical protein
LFAITIFCLGFVAGMIGTLVLSCYISATLESRQVSRLERLGRS